MTRPPQKLSTHQSPKIRHPCRDPSTKSQDLGNNLKLGDPQQSKYETKNGCLYNPKVQPKVDP